MFIELQNEQSDALLVDMEGLSKGKASTFVDDSELQVRVRLCFCAGSLGEKGSTKFKIIHRRDEVSCHQTQGRSP